MDLEGLSLTELSHNEKLAIEGGSFWGWLAVIAGAVAVVAGIIAYVTNDK